MFDLNFIAMSCHSIDDRSTSDTRETVCQHEDKPDSSSSPVSLSDPTRSPPSEPKRSPPLSNQLVELRPYQLPNDFTQQHPSNPQWVVIDVNRREMELVCVRPDQKEILQLPGRSVVAIATRVRTSQIETRRPSYVNALLIQSRGQDTGPMCINCRTQHLRGIGPGPFPVCIRLPGYFGGCCGNCKWRDYGSRCSLYNKD